MIVVTSTEIENTTRHATGPGWDSKRMIIKRDGMGFSVHETRVREGSELQLEYKNHVEANYCYAGEGEVTDIATGVTYPIVAGTIYALENHDAHIVRAIKGDLHLVCVFNPALTGFETHTDDGSYDIPSD